jgi:hypothetical protein
MLTKSRTTLAAALAVAALGATPALAAPIDPVGSTTDARGEHAASLSERSTTVEPAGGTSDARGEHAASLSERSTTGANATDLRSADAREPFVRPVVVEVGDPASGGFDWTAGIAGLAGGLALAILAGVGVAGARRRSFRTVG